MNKAGVIEVTTAFSGGTMTTNTYDVFQIQLGEDCIVGKANQNSSLQMTNIAYNVDLTNVDDLNAFFNVGGVSNNFDWITPMTEIPNDSVSAPIALESGKNLDTLTTPGVYYATDAPSDSYVIYNRPEAMVSSQYCLEVLVAGGSGKLIQRATRCHKTEQVVAERVYYSGSWGDWHVVSMNGQKVLWSGTWFMNADQNANLSELVTEQMTGITLVFSAFENNAAQDTAFVFHDIPKHFVQNHAGCGANFFMCNASGSKAACKYLYIHNDKIVGHSNNGVTATTAAASGLKLDNRFWVLRYVLGK